MKIFYRSIILFVVAFVAVVGFAPQAKALDGNNLIISKLCLPACSPLQTCVNGKCVSIFLKLCSPVCSKFQECVRAGLGNLDRCISGRTALQ